MKNAEQLLNATIADAEHLEAYAKNKRNNKTWRTAAFKKAQRIRAAHKIADYGCLKVAVEV